MEEVSKWLKKAHKDFDDAQYNIEGSRYETACFLSQQAAEKALKALYIKQHEQLWRTHDVVELARKLDATEGILEACSEVYPHYIQTRYPVDVEYNEETAKEAVQQAEVVLKWVQKKI